MEVSKSTELAIEVQRIDARGDFDRRAEEGIEIEFPEFDAAKLFVIDADILVELIIGDCFV